MTLLVEADGRRVFFPLLFQVFDSVFVSGLVFFFAMLNGGGLVHANPNSGPDPNLNLDLRLSSRLMASKRQSHVDTGRDATLTLTLTLTPGLQYCGHYRCWW